MLRRARDEEDIVINMDLRHAGADHVSGDEAPVAREQVGSDRIAELERALDSPKRSNIFSGGRNIRIRQTNSDST